MRSFYNALNRHESLRAYSYWEPGTAGTFAQFVANHSDTASVELATGPSTTEAAAGQRYEAVPVALLEWTANGTLRTLAGCYRTHLASPSAQATPPFQPFAIASASLREAASGASIGDLLKGACG